MNNKSKMKKLHGQFCSSGYYVFHCQPNATTPTLLVNLSSIWVSQGAMILFYEKNNRCHWMGNLICIIGLTILIGGLVVLAELYVSIFADRKIFYKYQH